MDTRKIIQALCFMANNQPGGVIDTMKAYKLIWLSDRWHLRNYTRTVTGDVYFALPYGPVPSDAKNLIDRKPTSVKSDTDMFNEYIEVMADHKYRARKEANLKVFSESDREAMKLVIEKFNHMSAVELSNFSHTFPEWKQYEHLLNDTSKKNGYKMDKDLFYVNMLEPSGIFVDDPEKLEFLKSMFHLHQAS